MGKFEMIQGRDGMFRFNLRAANGEIVATGEQCSSESECRRCLEEARKLSLSPVEDQINGKQKVDGSRFEMYLDKAGEFRFRLVNAEGRILLHGEGYRSKRSCKNGIASIGKNAGDAPVISLI